MLSRVASSVYWMTRYLERADNVARFVDVNAHLILDLNLEEKDSQWEPMVRITGDESLYAERYGKYEAENVVRFLLFDGDNPNSVLACVSNVRENARTVREIISSEMWEVANSLYHLVQKQSRKRTLAGVGKFLEAVHDANHLFTGHMHNTMSNGEAWQFAHTGRYMERADKTARMLDIKYFLLLPDDAHVGSVLDSVEWGAVLKSVSAFEMYQKQFHIPNYRDVTDFLILDPDFPRAIRFCVSAATRSLARITETLGKENTAIAGVEKLKTRLDNSDIRDILAKGLHGFIDDLQRDLNGIDEAIFRSFFSPGDSGDGAG